MKKQKKELISSGLAILNAMALAGAKQSVNSACTFIHHQPKMPQEMKKFKK